ncbi:zinc finger and BTB domain-containing protein 21 [Pseudophryne corroboree]|uniref:zinc finger and BTB domain-containing protein 21 n=1 Tax=Pseudophryne corroboree TaxID=495146 RepID=UPI00308138F8
MDGLLHYINPAHAISMLSSLNEERLKGQLCDVLLIVGDQKFRAHKNVLAASSEYFHSLFMDKNNESQTVFQLDFCEADAFDNVLNYIYSSSLFAEKGSLAAVQELGYSLGISFLTNILSKTPQAPFSSCPSKKSALQEEDDSGSQQRSVIVCQSRNEAQSRDVSNLQDKSQASKPSSSMGKANSAKHHMRSDSLSSFLASERKWHGSSNSSGERSISGWLKRNTLLHQKTYEGLDDDDDGDDDDDHPSSSRSLSRGHALEIYKKKMVPSLLCSSESSFSTPDIKRESPQSKEEERNLMYYSQLALVDSSAGSSSQRIDRSGPLVKSLLRRSLSMDSQVPAYSQTVDLQSLQVTSALKDNSKRDASCSMSHRHTLKGAVDKASIRDEGQEKTVDLMRPFTSSQSTATEMGIRIKAEPSSPASEQPSEIFQITVGDASQTRSRPRPLHPEHETPLNRLPAKRRFQADRRMLPRRVKMKSSSSPESEYNFREDTTAFGDFSDSDDSKEMGVAIPEILQSKKFKCKHCLKIFRSTAGLHRHMNMYHNPEKPYSCDICYKRFHTNFKVWTHCQTQHGIVKNPSPASSAQAVLDEKFQRKLIDIVREREIKKALMFKLRRGKAGFPGMASSQAQALKRSRSRTKTAFTCNHCGKAYRFLSQLKQHCKMHPGEKSGYSSKNIRPKVPSPPKSPVESKEVFHCRLCNAKLSSFVEQGNHERMCRNATLCPYCSLRFSTPELKNEHEPKCEYKKLTCLECMRTFKSSFSIWRHQVEVHNQNTMTPTENFSLPLLDHNGEISNPPRLHSLSESSKGNNNIDDGEYSDSSEHMNFDSEDSNCLPEDLSISKPFSMKIKEEPVDDMDDSSEAHYDHKEDLSGSERGMWSCEKCGKMFTVFKQLERHQELLCSVKPFICHVCNKAFRTNFRLWSHFQSHMGPGEDSFKETEACAPMSSPSPPPTPLPQPPPLPPKIEPIEPERGTIFPEKSNATEKVFAPQESDTLFYHAPPLSAITFKRQFMCKLCHRTFKTAFSLWSHEQTHN